MRTHAMVARAALSLLAAALLLLLAPDTRPARAAALGRGLEERLAAAGPGDRVAVILLLAGRADLRGLPGGRGVARSAPLLRRLRSANEAAVGPLRPLLARPGADRVERLWLINGLALRASPSLVRELALSPGVEEVRLDATLRAPEPAAAEAAEAEWNLAALRAPELWALGHVGAGVTVALLDTGVDAFHADLAARWRGGWLDPYGEHAAPHDASGHGTQVAGILLGGDAGGSSIGVAPGALWIAAKIFDDSGVGTLGGIHQAFQWALDPDGDPDTDDAPAVVNASFGFDDRVGECFTEFEADIAVLRAAGIPVVFSAGNSGPGELTSVSPANNAGALPVGAVDRGLRVARFSSRGPSACGGGPFPRLAAPGVAVRTADLTAGGVFPATFTSVSGTSAAAPHVAGLLALLAGVYPGAGPAELENALESTALDLGAAGPDPAAGYGLPDVVRAYRVLAGQPSCPDDDADGYFPWLQCGTPLDCDDLDPAVHPGSAEIPLDGVDQDCNGYDLTIQVTRAVWRPETMTLRVRATSALGRRAALRLQGRGPMAWNRAMRRWGIVVRDVRRDPGTVLVTGREGARAAPTVVR